MIKQGSGWRVGWKTEDTLYQGLIGADDWAMELTRPEMDDFRRLLLQLSSAIADMSKHLMEEEVITCEVESELIWLGAEGYPDNYSLRVILNQNRSCEGTWRGEVIPNIILALKTLETF